MSIKVILFGQIAEITDSHSLELEGITDTDELKQHLQAQYPALANTKYVVAVDKKMITENTSLSSHHTVALLPPFSGG